MYILLRSNYVVESLIIKNLQMKVTHPPADFVHNVFRNIIYLDKLTFLF